MASDRWYDRHPVLASFLLLLAVLVLFGAAGAMHGPDPNAATMERPYEDPASGPQGLMP